MARQSKKLLRNKSVKRSKLNNVRLGKKGTRHRKPWKKRTMRGGMFGRSTIGNFRDKFDFFTRKSNSQTSSPALAPDHGPTTHKPLSEEDLYPKMSRDEASDFLKKKGKKKGKEVKKGLYLLRISDNTRGVVLNVLKTDGTTGNFKLDDIFSKFDEKKSIPEVIKHLSETENFIGVKLRRKMVVWDFDKTFMRDHWWRESRGLTGNIEEIFKTIFEKLKKNDISINTIEDCLSYPNIKVLLHLLYNNGYVLAIASAGKYDLIIKVLEKLNFLKYFDNNIITPTDDRVSGLVNQTYFKNAMLLCLMTHNNIRKNDVFFYDDSIDNILAAQNKKKISDVEKKILLEKDWEPIKVNEPFKHVFNTPIPFGFNEDWALQLIDKLGFTRDFYFKAITNFNKKNNN